MDQYESEVKRLCSENAFLTLIYDALEEKLKKKKKKRNKRKLKKKLKQEVSTTNTDPGKLTDIALHLEEEDREHNKLYEKIIENFSKMVISENRRECRVDEEWL